MTKRAKQTIQESAIRLESLEERQFLSATFTLDAPDLASARATPYYLSVRMQDSDSIALASLDSSDLRVVGPKSYYAVPTFVGTNSGATTGAGKYSANLNAVYKINAADGKWDANDEGEYQVYLRAGQVKDSLGAFLPETYLGSFKVDMQFSAISMPPASYGNSLGEFAFLSDGSPVILTSSSFSVWTGADRRSYQLPTMSLVGADAGGRLAVDAQDHIWILTPVTSNPGLHLREYDRNGLLLSTHSLAGPAAYPDLTSLLVDANQKIHVVYTANVGGSANQIAGGHWTISSGVSTASLIPVEEAPGLLRAASGTVGLDGKIWYFVTTIAGANSKVVAYHETANGWERTVLADSINYQSTLRAAVSPVTGQPILAVAPGTQGLRTYERSANGTWQTTEIESPFGGTFTIQNIDVSSNGRVLIAYRSIQSTALTSRIAIREVGQSSFRRVDNTFNQGTPSNPSIPEFSAHFDPNGYIAFDAGSIYMSEQLHTSSTAILETANITAPLAKNGLTFMVRYVGFNGVAPQNASQSKLKSLTLVNQATGQTLTAKPIYSATFGSPIIPSASYPIDPLGYSLDVQYRVTPPADGSSMEGTYSIIEPADDLQDQFGRYNSQRTVGVLKVDSAFMKELVGYSRTPGADPGSRFSLNPTDTTPYLEVVDYAAYGNTRVAIVHGSAKDISYSYLLTFKDGAWSREFLQFNPKKVVFDKDGNLLLADDDYPTSVAQTQLQYNMLLWRRVNGVWTKEVVDETGYVGATPSLVLDKQGMPHVSYFDATNNVLKYAYKDLSGWHLQVVENSPAKQNSVLLLDDQDKPVIVHAIYSAATVQIVAARWNGSDWVNEVIAQYNRTDNGYSDFHAVMREGRPEVYLITGDYKYSRGLYQYRWSGDIYECMIIDPFAHGTPRAVLTPSGVAIGYYSQTIRVQDSLTYPVWGRFAMEQSDGSFSIQTVTETYGYVPGAFQSIVLPASSPDGVTLLTYLHNQNTGSGPSVYELTPFHLLPNIAVKGKGIVVADDDATPVATDGTLFATVKQGAVGPTATFAITNTGEGSLELGALSLPTGFALIDAPSTSLAPGASDTFTIAVVTNNVGTFAGDVSLVTNVAGKSPFNFRIQAQVLARLPGISVTGKATSITDGDPTPSTGDGTQLTAVKQGATPPTATFTVSNPGDAALTLGTVTLPAGFTLIEGLSSTLAPGESDTFTVSLITDAAGTFSGDVSFDTNVTGKSPYNFRVQGSVLSAAAGIAVTGKGALIPDGDVAPVFNDGTQFTAVKQGATPPTATFTVSNPGDAALTLGTVTLPAGFTLVEGLSSTLAPGESDSFTVSLITSAAGTFSGDVSIDTNVTGKSPFNFRIQGSVLSAAAGIAVTGLGVPVLDDANNARLANGTDFGVALAGTDGPVRTFLIANTGDGNLALTNLVLPDGFIVRDGLATNLGPGESDQLVIALETADVGRFGGAVTFSTNAAGHELFDFVLDGSVAAGVPHVFGATTPVSGRTFIDNDHNRLIVTVSGPGTATVVQAADGKLLSLTLSDTDAMRTSLGIEAMRDSVGSKSTSIASIGSVWVQGGLKKFTAGNLIVNEAFAAEGFIKTMTIGDISGTLNLGSTNSVKDQTTLTLGRVSELSINSVAPIKALTAIEWIDADSVADTISAPWIGSIAITGSVVDANLGSFEADLDLSGSGAPKGVALSKFTTKKDVIGSNWNIVGNVGTVTVGGVIGSSELRITGNIGTVTTDSIVDSLIFAGVALDAEAALPSTFVSPTAAITSLIVKGMKGEVGAPSFSRSMVAAGVLTKVSLKVVDPVNDGKPFGFVADKIKSLSRTGGMTLKNLDIANANNDMLGNDFIVRTI